MGGCYSTSNSKLHHQHLQQQPLDHPQQQQQQQLLQLQQQCLASQHKHTRAADSTHDKFVVCSHTPTRTPDLHHHQSPNKHKLLDSHQQYQQQQQHQPLPYEARIVDPSAACATTLTMSVPSRTQTACACSTHPTPPDSLHQHLRQLHIYTTTFHTRSLTHSDTFTPDHIPLRLQHQHQKPSLSHQQQLQLQLQRQQQHSLACHQYETHDDEELHAATSSNKISSNVQYLISSHPSITTAPLVNSFSSVLPSAQPQPQPQPLHCTHQHHHQPQQLQQNKQQKLVQPQPPQQLQQPQPLPVEQQQQQQQQAPPRPPHRREDDDEDYLHSRSIFRRDITSLMPASPSSFSVSFSSSSPPTTTTSSSSSSSSSSSGTVFGFIRQLNSHNSMIATTGNTSSDNYCAVTAPHTLSLISTAPAAIASSSARSCSSSPSSSPSSSSCSTVPATLHTCHQIVQPAANNFSIPFTSASDSDPSSSSSCIVVVG